MGLSSPTCCCGRLHCAYLQQNSSALVSLENDLRYAAQLGQVRLSLYCGLRGEPRSINRVLRVSRWLPRFYIGLARSSTPQFLNP